VAYDIAYGFAIACVFGAVIFLSFGVIRRGMRFARAPGWRQWAGIALLAYALLIYPLVSWMGGIRYFGSPTFGLPCPTTIFTIGMLAFLVRPFPRALFIVPVLWSMIGGQAAFVLSVPQDFGLLGAGAFGVVLAWLNRMGTLSQSGTVAEVIPNASNTVPAPRRAKAMGRQR